MKIGLDLGTTNSALAYVDEREAAGQDVPPVHVFEIPQTVAPGRVEARSTLPSFLLLEEGQPVGAYARDQGALVPTHLVHSAKSWLANPEVDRTARILPWDSPEAGRVLSPVEVSARFVATIREQWDRAMGTPLAEQDVVLTVPASFDEEGRELTVQAAADAGLGRLTLLEEPSAAFYAWIADHLEQWRARLFDGEVVLVCDVGGGTSDFSLIRVSREGDSLDFTRTAVGRHLLLGGDNLDLAIARQVEEKLGRPLSIRQRSALRRQCSAAKEVLLGDSDRASVEITVLGSGSALVGDVLRVELRRQDVLDLALDGFLPLVELGEGPGGQRRHLFRELGLPYEADPAITHHLGAFLESAGQAPDAILFNGGFFVPELLRERVVEVVGRWQGRPPEVLESSGLDLAVARGAAYYAYARATGHGVLVRGGLPRTYYLGLGQERDGKRVAMCLVPRGAEAGAEFEVDDEALQLVTNRPVAFHLYSSLERAGDRLGQVVEFAAEDPDLHLHAPLRATIRFGKNVQERLIPVKVGARLTEIGTLECWCASKITEHRWRLQFDLRKAAAEAPATLAPATVVSDEAMQAAVETVGAGFARSPASPIDPRDLPARLEEALGLRKKAWPLPVLRRLSDALLATVDGRKKSPAHEARWLNLVGYCLRPGFGYPGDELRIEQARRVYAAGLVFGNKVQSEIDWYLLWGRVAGGLNRTQQVALYQRMAGLLLPRGGKKPKYANPALHREMWRAAASLELLPVGAKTELGDALINRVRSGDFGDSELWCLSRIGARALFYGPANLVVPPETATRWVQALLRVDAAGPTLASLARLTGDQARDLAPETRDTVRRKLETLPRAERLLATFEGEAEDEQALAGIFGEDLPSGLVLRGAEAAAG